MGRIGRRIRRIEVEPIQVPDPRLPEESPEPEYVPEPEPEKEPVPAGNVVLC